MPANATKTKSMSLLLQDQVTYDFQTIYDADLGKSADFDLA